MSYPIFLPFQLHLAEKEGGRKRYFLNYQKNERGTKYSAWKCKSSCPLLKYAELASPQLMSSKGHRSSLKILLLRGFSPF